ncbi:WAT1-related protein At5g64700 [Linum perenne]
MDPKTTPFLNDGKKAYGAVVLTQLIYAGMFLFSKAAFDGGLNTAVFVFYRQAFAAAVLVPLALSLEWKHAPPLPAMTFCKIFALSLGGITLSLNINGVALIYTSATLAAATVNSLPVITFFLALLCGMETLKVKTRTGIAKLIGIGICMGGVATLAFYKGPHFNLNFCLFGHHPTSTSTSTHTSTPPNNTWIKGCFLMLFSNVSWGFWLVFQSFVVAIAVERNPEEWKLGWNMRLVAVAYCGVVVTGVTYYLQAWVLEKKGPVFLASSTPLALIFTMVFSALLCDFVTLGSVLGGVLLIGGLYSVLWAKGKEEKMIRHEEDEIKKVPKVEETELKQVVTMN